MPDQFEALIDKLEGVHHRGRDQVDAKCPAHPDNKSSLSVARGADGRVVMTCHAGCHISSILSALDVPLSDLFGEPRMVAEYVYTDEDGTPLYVVERWEPKAFRQRMIDGKRRAPKPEERVIYNAPAVAAVRNSPDPAVFYVEGEKDVEALTSKGFAATTTLGGANKPWLPQYTEALAGLRVVIVADNDDPGRKWARAVARHLEERCEVRVVVPPRGIKDVSEVLEAGFAVTDLLPMRDTIGELVTAADYPVRSVEWLWPGRIPMHMLTLLEGDPGTGKSTLTMELIACLTTGTPLPQETGRREPMTVGLLSDEDNWSMVVTPRLQAAGADLTRVIHFRGIRDADDFLVPYSLPDLATLRHDIRKSGVDVLLIDPLMAYLGADLDTHRDSSVRSVLGPLVQMAEEDGVTILAVRHFTKGSLGGKAIYRGGGSIGFTGQARAVLQTGEYPQQQNEEDPEAGKGRYVLAVAKCNLAPLSPTLAYRITTDERMDVSRIVWEPLPVPVTAAELSHQGAGPGQTDRERADALGPGKDAADWLANLLADGKERTWKEIAELGKGTHSEVTLRRARNEVAVQVLGTRGQASAAWRGIKLLPDPRLLTADRTQTHEQTGANAPDEQTGTDTDWAKRAANDRDDDDETPSTIRPHTDHTSPSSLAHPERLIPLAHGSAFGEERANGNDGPPSCSVCGQTEALVINEEGEARCQFHHWLVYTLPSL
jgi:putative DNA primase/helicase